MANLTSSLTLTLNDLMSKPAGEAAAALKKFGLSAQDLQKATKLDQLKVVQADFQKVSLAVTNTGQTVKVPTERLAASGIRHRNCPASPSVRTIATCNGEAGKGLNIAC